MPFEIDGKIENRTLIAYVPHGINSNIFKPLPTTDPRLVQRKKEFLQGKNYNYILCYNSRNVHRKRTSNIVLAYRNFCDNLSMEEAKKCCLILHTEIRCDAGTDLIAVKEALCPNYDIIFSTAKILPEDMCCLYNIADITINASCIPPGYKITTINGPKSIEEIKIGENVLTYKGRFRKVLKTFEYDNKDCEMVKITPFSLSDPLELTSEHKVWAVKRKKMDNGLINENKSIQKYMEWIPAGELSPGDLVMYPELKEDLIENVVFDMEKYITIEKENCIITEDTIKLKCGRGKDKLNRIVKLDVNLSYLLGRWCGDGSFGRSSLNISFDSKYGNDEIIKLGNIFVEKFGGSFSIKPHYTKSKTCTMLYFHNNCINAIVNLFIQLCGNESHNKHTPNEILYNVDITILDSFIKGLIDSDGCDRKCNESYHTKITTVSNLLKQQLIFALVRLTKKVRLSEGKSGYKPGNTHHQIIFTHTKNDNGSSRSWFRDGYYLMSINKIEKYSYTGKVYNVEVEEDHSYVMSCGPTVCNSNEGFGLSTAESIMCGTPIIVNVTGGLQDQIGLVDENNKPIEFTLEWGSNFDGKYKNYGVWAKALFPTARYVQGSIPTPYILDDLCKWEDLAEAMMYWYSMDKEKRELCGLKGREWSLGIGGLNSNNMCDQFIKAMDFCFDKWKPVEPIELITYNDYVGNQMPQGKLGFTLPKIDINKVKKEVETTVSLL